MLGFLKKLTGSKDQNSAHNHTHGGGCCGGMKKAEAKPVEEKAGGCCGGHGHHHHDHDHGHKTH